MGLPPSGGFCDRERGSATVEMAISTVTREPTQATPPTVGAMDGPSILPDAIGAPISSAGIQQFAVTGRHRQPPVEAAAAAAVWPGVRGWAALA